MSDETSTARAQRIADAYRAEALCMTVESDTPTHHETVWSDVAGALAFALAVRSPQLSEYDVRCEAERMLLHLTIDESARSLQTTRGLECSGCTS